MDHPRYRALLVELQQQYGSWLELLPMGRNLGCIANVNCLLEASRAPYVALADQDDIWLPEKLVETFALLQRLEHQHGVQQPLLVHSDLELMDADGHRLGSTYVKHQHLDPRRTAPEPLALTNVVTGCTAMVNRALLDRALPIPSEALMHDWWLALVASCFGAIGWLPQPTVLYRQHGGNVLGAQGLGRPTDAPAPASIDRSCRWWPYRSTATGGVFEQYSARLCPAPALMHLRRHSRCQALSHHLTHEHLMSWTFSYGRAGCLVVASAATEHGLICQALRSEEPCGATDEAHVVGPSHAHGCPASSASSARAAPGSGVCQTRSQGKSRGHLAAPSQSE